MSQDQFDKAIGAQLRSLREVAGLSQETLCIDIGFDQSTLSKLERIGPTACTWRNLCQIAAVLGYEAEIQLHPKLPKPR